MKIGHFVWFVCNKEVSNYYNDTLHQLRGVTTSILNEACVLKVLNKFFLYDRVIFVSNSQLEK